MLDINNLPEGVVTLEQAKKDPKPGTKFFVPQTGSVGTILEERSGRGKLQARMTCTKGGPDHIREVSDWHQCGVSPEMKKTKKKAKKTDKPELTPEQAVAAAEAKRAELEAKLAEAKKLAGIANKPAVEAKPEPESSDEADESIAEAV